MGTHFVVTTESQVHENYKDMIIHAKDIDTRVTGRTTGHPVRALRNDMTKKYLALENSGAGFEELELLTLGRSSKSRSRRGCEERKCHVRTDCRSGKRKNVMSGTDSEAGNRDRCVTERNRNV